MSVYNGCEFLRSSVTSILEQDFGDFEFIIVNDGSTDASRDILAEFVHEDRRIRVLDQENQGLTKSLIRGCAEARGEYIARQDADDWSHPQRLGRQVRYLAAHPEVTLLSCFTRLVGPEDEDLYTVERYDAPQEATSRLRATRLKMLRGINAHGSAIFRRDEYRRTGGYRWQFYFAQDLDLWTRLTDFGLLAFVPEVLYHARFEPSAISGRHAALQRELAKIVIELCAARNRGDDETPLLERARTIRPESSGWRRPVAGSGDYFIGRVLQRRGDPRAIAYLRRAVEINPLHFKARLTLLLSRLHVL